MRGFRTVEKHVGETPLTALRRYREEADIPSDIPLAYAGRLDPMASGKLLILIGDSCKQQEEYHALNKAYEFLILHGFSSDTQDVLGLAKRHAVPEPKESALILSSKKYTGTITFPYPHFSSKTVKDKPLHVWTLEGRLGEIEIPTTTSTIYRLTYRGVRTARSSDLLKYIHEKIDTLPAQTEESKSLGKDFRRGEIHTRWDALLKDEHKIFTISSFSCVCSSGTYMRTLADHIGAAVGTGGLALSIHRSVIGKYRPFGTTYGFWTRKY